LILMMMVDGDVIDIDQLNKKKNHFGIQWIGIGSIEHSHPSIHHYSTQPPFEKATHSHRLMKWLFWKVAVMFIEYALNCHNPWDGNGNKYVVRRLWFKIQKWA
jgi:hypothetical protein